ncbi:hypothetical protein EVU91_07950 [Macrococcoides bohemicum]|uniref:hypothetical protein n=1 Tax=Macrococcoides bohemicum TaxID=1903056 RepID=UPI001059D847|nr:hypothetical protein [Macrococcus bohemicus]TDL37019.1 hypothetical protein EVU91_07950 [Macrococcus bohemicus]
MNIKFEVDSVQASMEDLIGKLDRLSTGLKDFEGSVFPENYVPDQRDIENYIYAYPEHKRNIEMHTQLLEKYLKEFNELNGQLLKVNKVLWQEKTDNKTTDQSDLLPAPNEQ